ncbi:SOSS complex subunit B2 [Dermatophagoides pteronyssinus]|uniref:SOSS complex subunit B2 n=1 Tax=Dermatophagoides pteronyssinus TaxID=6956 RepID=UPI003F67AAED
MGYSINQINMTDKIDSIKDIKAPSNKLNVIAIAVEIVSRLITKDNHEIRVMRFADRTGCINMCLYDELGATVQPGDICHITRCYATFHKGALTLYMGRHGKLTKIGEFCMTFTETPNMSDGDPSTLSSPSTSSSTSTSSSSSTSSGPPTNS